MSKDQAGVYDGEWWFRVLGDGEGPDRGEYEFKYIRHHSYFRGEVRIACLRRVDFLELLNAWNRRGNGVWVYYEA